MSNDVLISKETKQALQNLNFINSNLYIEPGSRLRSISENDTQYAEIFVDDEFLEEMYIYDLGKFLSLISLFNEPVIRSYNSNVKCSILNRGYNNSMVDYYYASPEIITRPPEDEIVIEESDEDTTFQIDYNTLQSLIKAASIIEGEFIRVANKDDNIVVSAIRKDVPDSNSYHVTFDQGNSRDEPYEIYLRTEHLNFLPNDYTVRINGDRATFQSIDDKYKYVVGVDEDSVW